MLFQLLITLFPCAASVFAQQHRVGTSGPSRRRCKVRAVGITALRFLNEEYDPATNSWKMLKAMPTARSGMAVAVLDGKIFAFGGERPGGTFNQTEANDPATNTWAVLTPMPMSVHGTGAVTIGETIYIPAGGTLNGGTAQTTGNQAFTLK